MHLCSSVCAIVVSRRVSLYVRTTFLLTLRCAVAARLVFRIATRLPTVFKYRYPGAEQTFSTTVYEWFISLNWYWPKLTVARRALVDIMATLNDGVDPNQTTDSNSETNIISVNAAPADATNSDALQKPLEMDTTVHAVQNPNLTSNGSIFDTNLKWAFGTNFPQQPSTSTGTGGKLVQPDIRKAIKAIKRRGAGNSPKNTNKIPKVFAHIPTSPIQTQNQFEILGDSTQEKPANTIAPKDKQNVTPNAKTGEQPKAHGPKPPPITITNPQEGNPVQLLNSSGAKFTMRILSLGLKVFPENVEGHIAIINALKNSTLQFFTHPMRSDGKLKVVLKGLPRVDTNDIASDLGERHNLVPSAIRLIPTQGTMAMFCVEFPKTITSLKHLQDKVTNILYYKVTWEASRKRNTGPTLCNKCSMFGHGAANCARAPVCSACAGAHPVSDCQTASNSNEDTTAAPPIYNCANCAVRKLKSDHRADDPTCATKALLIAARNEQKPPSKTGPEWPKLPEKTRAPNGQRNQRQSQHDHQAAQRPQPSPAAFSWRGYKEATASDPRAQPSNTSSDIFSPHEIIDIMLNAIDEIAACNSKIQQLRVVTNLLSKCL